MMDALAESLRLVRYATLKNRSLCNAGAIRGELRIRRHLSWISFSCCVGSLDKEENNKHVLSSFAE